MPNFPMWFLALVSVALVLKALRPSRSHVDVEMAAAGAADADSSTQEGATASEAALFQLRLTSQTRRMDGIENTLGALAALLVAALVWLHGDSNKNVAHLSNLLVLPLIISLAATIGANGNDAPELDIFPKVLKEGRPAAYKWLADACVVAFTRNKKPLRYKEWALRGSVIATMAVLLASLYSADQVIWLWGALGDGLHWVSNVVVRFVVH